MRRRLVLLLTAGLLTTVVSLPMAQQSAAQHGPPGRAPDNSLPEDPAFDRYVDLRLIGQGMNELNAALVADAALQLAEGERILVRSHKAISAKDALQLAVKMAAEKRDKATLQRLGDYAKRSGDQGLAQQIAQAQTLAGAGYRSHVPDRGRQRQQHRAI